MTWVVERHHDTAASLHGLAVADDGVRRIWILEPSAPAVVLGSTQDPDVVDQDAAARAGLAVVSRRSGGGAVWVAPDDLVWVDIVVPRHDPLWDDDVGRSFLPIGEAWCRALETVGLPGGAVHRGPMIRTEWSDDVCFAGTGPGEVLIDDAKVVGISQRRTRAGARFQCAVPRAWDPEPLRRLLRRPPPPGVLDGCGTGIGAVDTGDLVAALTRALG